MREIPEGINLDGLLCIKTERTLRNDFTVAYNKKLYQIEDATKAKKVIVEERIDGKVFITHHGVSLKYKEIMVRPERPKKHLLITFKPRKKYIPPKDHPWRRFRLGRHAMNKQT